MGLREEFTEALKASMKAGDTATTSTIRMIIAKLKELDIARRDLTQADAPREADEASIQAMLRGMIKSRRESVALYRQGGREDLAAKEEAEIAVIARFLPPELDEAGIRAAIADAIAETGAAGLKDMGKVMGALKARHGAALDLAKAGPLVKAALAG
ncbi:GatB/YqeY domain-containing protein [Elioraea tepida]|jgi:hypothetical protein|uniref:GatB/YqeY domain-containing protein n=1 Tax=Elioraea tepida TaxID=2843330 RepID=A0A975YKD3_9PROT|nr:GatB/YqeY domain-containing protein [Elioraea tepida]QXM25645.1 GatB/YqeY domain-containing protein [Elioraea tepida]